MLIMMDMILSNSAVGLLDLNLNQQQKYWFIFINNSYEGLFRSLFRRQSEQGQKLEEVKDLILDRWIKSKR